MSASHKIMQFFRPLKGCRIYASKNHPDLSYLDHVGIVVSVDKNIIAFKDRTGKIDYMIWRFKEGNNKTIVFGA